jgi:hypothetical protein
MRKRRIRRTLIWLAPGGLLWLSCPAGTLQFLAPIIQPIIGQVLSEFAAALTDDLLHDASTDE